MQRDGSAASDEPHSGGTALPTVHEKHITKEDLAILQAVEQIAQFEGHWGRCAHRNIRSY